MFEQLKNMAIRLRGKLPPDHFHNLVNHLGLQNSGLLANPGTAINKMKARGIPPGSIPNEFTLKWLGTPRDMVERNARESKFLEFIYNTPLDFHGSVHWLEAGEKYGWRSKTPEEATMEDKTIQTFKTAYLLSRN